MIPAKSDNFIDGNIGDAKKIPFRIAANSFMFNTIRREIYTDPVSSVVREIIANGLDAQSENGSTEPLTIIEGESLVIIDHGPGITRQVLEEVLTVYGNSSKRETNDQVGQYGLGSKSIFAITDQFSIETVITKDGSNFKSTYVATLDESEGGGIIILQDDLPTDEPTSTKIKIPIKNDIRSQIAAAIERYCTFTTPRPLVAWSGNKVVDWAKPKIETDRWAIYDKDVLSKYKFNVLYNEIPYYVDNLDLPTGLVVKFKIGELELPASRESVRRTPELVDIVNNTINDYKDYLAAWVQSSIESIQDAWDLVSFLKTHETLIKLIKSEITWQGITIPLPFDDHYMYAERASHYSNRKLDINYVKKSTDQYQFYKTYYLFKIIHKDAILLVENAEQCENSYHRRKIYKFLQDSGQREVLLINQEGNYHPFIELFRQYATPIKDVKLVNNKSETVKDVYNIQVGNHKSDKMRVNIYEGDFIYHTSKMPRHDYFPGGRTCIIPTNSRVYKKIQGLPNWFTPETYLIKKLAEKNLTLNDLDKCVQYGYYKTSSMLIRECLPVEKLIDNYDEKVKQNYETNKDLINFSLNNNLTSAKIDIADKIVEKYPLLSEIISYSYPSEETIKNVKNYIKLIDNYGDKL